MSKPVKTLILAGFLCTCMMAINVAAYADDTDTTTTKKAASSTRKSWKNTSPSKVKDAIQKYNSALTKQDAVNYNNLFKVSTLTKTQKSHYEKYLAAFKTAIKVAKESMNFYLEDLNDLITDNELTSDEKAKQAEDILARARSDYREAFTASQEFLRNCSYAMPTMTYQKFLKGFENNFYLGQLDMAEFSTMSTMKTTK